jgi:hypothetical protein
MEKDCEVNLKVIEIFWKFLHKKSLFVFVVFLIRKKKKKTDFCFLIYIFCILQQIDTNKDGVVTIDELVDWCSRDENILKSLEQLDTVLWCKLMKKPTQERRNRKEIYLSFNFVILSIL